MATLIITRGLPGCGKSTRAKAWVGQFPARRVRINRDDLRDMFHNGRTGTQAQEWQVTIARDAAVLALLRKGFDVVCDDTTLPQRHARELRALASLAGAEFEVWDMTDVPLETCLERNAQRTGTPAFVPEDAIRGLHERFVHGRPYPLPLPADSTGTDDDSGDGGRYELPVDAPDAIMVDIDGTAAIMCDRSPYDETRVGDDRPNAPVVAAVRAMHAAGYRILFLSGRTDGCRADTERWLAEHVGVPYDGLWMRAVGDQRKDSIVKAELFDKHVRHAYRVAFVLDDRRQVVERWREMGLTVFQVAPGEF